MIESPRPDEYTWAGSFGPYGTERILDTTATSAGRVADSFGFKLRVAFRVDKNKKFMFLKFFAPPGAKTGVVDRERWRIIRAELAAQYAKIVGERKAP